MKLTLSDLEEYIDPVIFARGMGYHQGGAITTLYRDGAGKVRAEVQGTRRYRIELLLSGDSVEEFSCSCPYDDGPICKHVVAVLLGLRESAEGGDNSDSAGDVDDFQSLEQYLSSRSKQELVDLVVEHASEDEVWQQLLLSRSATSVEEASRHYAELLRAGIEAAEDRDGFIGYREARQAASVALRLLDEAESALTDSDHDKVLAIVRPLIEVMYDALSGADDSNGEISGTIEQAVHCLGRMAAEELTEDQRLAVLNFVQDKEILSKLSDYGWEWDLLQAGAALVETDEEERALLASADSCVEDEEWARSYDEERRALLELELHQRRRTGEEAERFIADHIHLRPFRLRALEKLLQAGDTEGIYRLAKAGIEQDAAKAPGTAHEWQKWILRAAQEAHDVPVMRETAESLYFDTHNFEYLRLIKSTMNEKEWLEKREMILSDLDSNEWAMRNIYREEGLIDRLWRNVRRQASLRLLAEEASCLLPTYHGEMMELYERLVPEYLERNVGRGHYAEVGRMLAEMKESGEADRVSRLAELLLERYRNRRAMRDEFFQYRLLDGSTDSKGRGTGHR